MSNHPHSAKATETTKPPTQPAQPQPMPPDKAEPETSSLVEAMAEAMLVTTPAPRPTSPSDEPGPMDRIRELKRRGLNARQIKDLGYARFSVDDVFIEDKVIKGKT